MAPLTLHRIAGNTYYIPAPTLSGVWVRERRVVLIDSGNDKEAGRQILKALRERDWHLELIINTHSNADHIGGNAFLQKRTGCRIAATRMEAAFIQDPVLEPAFLIGGYPSGDIQNKFLMAKPSSVTDTIPSSGRILKTDLEAVPLPGHFFDMIGVKTNDSVLFLADCLYPERIISKYHIFFLYDLHGQFDTLQRVRTLEADWYVPSHGEPVQDVYSLVEINRAKIEEILEVVESLCARPCSTEALVSQVCKRYHIDLNVDQYVLVTSTLKSYLAYLRDSGKIESVIDRARMLWRRV